jgi:hypothetical protein
MIQLCPKKGKLEPCSEEILVTPKTPRAGGLSWAVDRHATDHELTAGATS